MALNEVGSYTLGEVNVALLASLGLLNPLLVQLDLFLTGQFGFGPFMADIQAQFAAAIAAALQLNISISNPILGLQMLVIAFGQLQAAISVALAFSMPTLSAQFTAQLAAVAALASTLALKIGGIKALMAAGLAAKIPAARFIAQMQATLSAGPVHLISFTGDSLNVTGGDISALFATGLGPSDPISPFENVSGILIVTKDPAVFAALGAILKTS